MTGTEERLRSLSIREAARAYNMPIIAMLIMRPFFPSMFKGWSAEQIAAARAKGAETARWLQEHDDD